MFVASKPAPFGAPTINLRVILQGGAADQLLRRNEPGARRNAVRVILVIGY